VSHYSMWGTATWDSDDAQDAYGFACLGPEFRWEFGYDQDRITYFAQLFDEAPMEDDEWPLNEEEREAPIRSVGQEPYGIRSVEELEGLMEVELPDEVLDQLRLERQRHLAGELDERPHVIAERLRAIRLAEGRAFLRDVQSLTPQGKGVNG
jgi:hypothetical protein